MAKAKRKRSKQANYQKQYSELLRNAKMIYQDLQLGLKLGEKTPSIEDILKEAGTKSGLKKPTKKSIQALKQLQSESGILRQAYWSMSKGPERDKAKELFEKAYDEEKHYKELQRKEIENVLLTISQIFISSWYTSSYSSITPSLFILA